MKIHRKKKKDGVELLKVSEYENLAPFHLQIERVTLFVVNNGLLLYNQIYDRKKWRVIQDQGLMLYKCKHF